MGSVKTIMTWCRQQGFYSGGPISYVYRLRHINRRSAFSIQQYRRIVTYLRTNDWLEVGKHNNDSRIIRHRMMLREYFLFACNIGMRISEMREIRWRDVTFAQTEAGKNYGWPVISYGRNYGGSQIGEGTHKIGMEQPVYFWDPSIAPSGFVFYNGDAFPGWKGNMFIGALKFQLLARLEIANNRIIKEERMFARAFGRIRDVRQGPDGYLYLLTDENPGQLLRIKPVRH